MADRVIKIAGAGPSGLAAAIALSKAGKSVQVFERAKQVGSKFINGLQILENYSSRGDVLELVRSFGVETDFVLAPAAEVDFYDKRLRRYRARCAQPYAYFVKRGPGPDTLDTSLLNQARTAGAEVVFESPVQPQDVDILATGPRTADGVAREIIFKTDLADCNRVILDRAITETGFAYLFVINGQATLGLALVSDFPSLGERVEKVLAKFQEIEPFAVDAPVTKSTHVNFFFRSHPARANGSPIAVGEAAGFQDLLWGIGIRRSLTSGWLASQALLGRADYRSSTRGQIERYMNASIVNRLVLEVCARTGFRPMLWVASRFDFRKFGLILTRPGLLKSILAGAIKWIWKNRSGCKHGPDCTWCRAS